MANQAPIAGGYLVHADGQGHNVVYSRTVNEASNIQYNDGWDGKTDPVLNQTVQGQLENVEGVIGDLSTTTNYNVSKSVTDNIRDAKADIKTLNDNLSQIGEIENIGKLKDTADILSIDFDKYRDIFLIPRYGTNYTRANMGRFPVSLIKSGDIPNVNMSHYGDTGHYLSAQLTFSYYSKTLKLENKNGVGWDFKDIMVYGLK